jgi:hypothetical protein
MSTKDGTHVARCDIKRDCKKNLIKKYCDMLYGQYIEYVGIAIDEKRRLNTLHKENNQISLLEKYNFTEEMARNLCEEYDLLSPSYQYTNRNGCWFCPYAKYEEQKAFKLEHPDVWREFVQMEYQDTARYKWNVNNDSLRERDERMVEEDLKKHGSIQMSVFDIASLRKPYQQKTTNNKQISLFE